MAPDETDLSTEAAHAVAWRVHRVTEETAQAFTQIAAQHGLTSVQARCVLRLHEPTRMSDLADHLRCDASNITGLADRLNDQGLVASRRGTDRRVKMLELTPKGKGVRRALARDVGARSLPMTRLTGSERETLIGLLDKLLAGDVETETAQRP